MTEQIRQPLEEEPEVLDAIEDDVAVEAFVTGGGPDADTPEFVEPGERPATAPGRSGAPSPEKL
ncbi:hypothetical protein GCM10010435_14840 [Winogradskya consettensis]|uniref:Uncharacterized protein n=1 Tax=Winogradskya consettensis TaxID=113560 RepID=A0A919SAW6_9ACTN|nr:hypothetical protein [Actinoplanes consettensis]GIM69185.1 hypothetical protein Aco04nite_14110 [Actinoplanes consettensis]